MQLHKEAAPGWLEDLAQYEDPSAGLTPSGKSFHGEMVPTKEASACYEPAFKIVRRFLEYV